MKYKDDFTQLEFEGETTTSAQKAIKAKCLDCCCYQKDEVRQCTSNACPLWPFRLGRNPYKKKRELTEEQLEARRERMRNLHKSKTKRATV